MNFFKSLAELALNGTLRIVIRQDTSQQMTVSVMLDAADCADPAARLIPPLCFSATPDQLDEGFLATIRQPLKTTATLHCDMTTHIKLLELARQQSTAQKAQAEQMKKGQTEKEKAYDTALKQIDELKAGKKYRQAVTKLPAVEDHPDHAEAITDLKEELMILLNEGSLLTAPNAISHLIQTVTRLCYRLPYFLVGSR